MTWVILIVFYIITHNNMQVCAHISPSWSLPPHHWPAKVICSFPISFYPLLPLLYFSPRNLSTLEIKLFICRLHCWNVNSNEMSSGRYLVHCYTPEPGTVICSGEALPGQARQNFPPFNIISFYKSDVFIRRYLEKKE